MKRKHIMYIISIVTVISAIVALICISVSIYNIGLAAYLWVVAHAQNNTGAGSLANMLSAHADQLRFVALVLGIVAIVGINVMILFHTHEDESA